MTTPFIANVRLFGGNFAPAGWAFCDGSQLPIASYEALYTLIGTTYGGDGVKTFALPDLRGRVAVSQGQGSTLSNYVIGGKTGQDTLTLAAAQMPGHSHALMASTATGTANTSSGNVLAAPAAAAGVSYAVYFNGTPPALRPLAASAIGNSGGNQGHDNHMPGLGLNYIIALEGIFPSQN